RFTISRDNAKN
nr:immunoglobulin heavy chain junction region [Homo sapiens]